MTLQPLFLIVLLLFSVGAQANQRTIKRWFEQDVVNRYFGGPPAEQITPLPWHKPAPDIAISALELNQEISEVIKKNYQLNLLKTFAENLGVHVYLKGETAATVAHYAKHNLR